MVPGWGMTTDRTGANRGLDRHERLTTSKGKDSPFVEACRALAAAETRTVTWYAFKLGDSQCRIFDSFETEDAALTNGGPDNGSRGPRPRFGGRYYAANPLDPRTATARRSTSSRGFTKGPVPL